MKKLLLTVLFTVIAPAFAVAATQQPNIAVSTNVKKQVCHIYSNSTTMRGTNKDGYNPCGTAMSDAKSKLDYVGYRLESMDTWSLSPINKHGHCVYLRNTSGNTYFIPAATKGELDSFFNHMPAGIQTKTCAPVTPIAAYLDENALCKTGQLYTSMNDNLLEPINAFDTSMPGKIFTYIVRDKMTGEELRRIYATAREGGWSISSNGPCKTPDEAGANGGATPAGFNRNAASQGQTTDRAFVTDGALIRNIKG